MTRYSFQLNGDLIGNKIANKITNVSKNSQQNTSETVTKVHDKEIPMEYQWNNGIIMEYQKIINLLENTLNQPSRFRTKSWVEVNDETRATFNVNSQVECKSSMLRSILCDSSDAYILASAPNTVEAGAAAQNKKI